MQEKLPKTAAIKVLINGQEEMQESILHPTISILARVSAFLSTLSYTIVLYAGHHAWNLLPENMRKSTSMAIFKRFLKTFLFEQITHSVH